MLAIVSSIFVCDPSQSQCMDFQWLSTAIFDSDLGCNAFLFDLVLDANIPWFLWLFHSVAATATAAATFYLFIYVPFFVARTGFYNWSHLCGETLWKSCKVADSSRASRLAQFVFGLAARFRFILFIFFFQFQRVHIQTRDNLYVVQISMPLQCLFMGSFWPLLLRSNVRKAWRILRICSSFCSSHIDFSFGRLFR